MSNLVSEVIAQSEPTFPYEGPFEGPDEGPSPTPSGQAAVKLSSSVSTLQVGGTATCDLSLESGEEEIQDYSIQITYDPDVLEVIDTNLTSSGIQINFLDSFSEEQTNNADNTNGVITLSASVTSGGESINRRIAQVTFRAKQIGTSIISINKTESSVKDTTDENIIGATTSLNYTVTGQTTTTSQQQLPSSGISDSIASLGSIFAGILMLYIGVIAIIKRRIKSKDLNKNPHLI